jgi:hypothetical protein
MPAELAYKPGSQVRRDASHVVVRGTTSMSPPGLGGRSPPEQEDSRIRRLPTLPPSHFPADRQRLAKRAAYLGCPGSVGYGGMKVIWALGGTLGMSNPATFHAKENGLPLGQRLFDDWGTPILAGLGMVILLGLVYPSGNKPVLRPLLRALVWAGSLVGVVGVIGLILTLSGTSMVKLSSGGNDWGSLDTGVYVFTYLCFVAVGVGFAVTAWLTRRANGNRGP